MRQQRAEDRLLHAPLWDCIKSSYVVRWIVKNLSKSWKSPEHKSHRLNWVWPNLYLAFFPIKAHKCPEHFISILSFFFAPLPPTLFLSFPRLSLLPWQAFFPCPSSPSQSFNLCSGSRQPALGCVWELLAFTTEVVCRMLWDTIRCIKSPRSSSAANEMCTTTACVW